MNESQHEELDKESAELLVRLDSSEKPVVDDLGLLPTEIKSEEKFNRIVVVETVYHQPHYEDPISVERRYTSRLSSDEQAYERRIKLDQEWKKVDFGWVESPGIILIYNRVPPAELVPSSEERAAQASMVVEVWVGPESLPSAAVSPVNLVPPLQVILSGEDTRFRLAEGCGLWLRSPAGKTRCHFHVFPK